MSFFVQISYSFCAYLDKNLISEITCNNCPLFHTKFRKARPCSRSKKRIYALRVFETQKSSNEPEIKLCPDILSRFFVSQSPCLATWKMKIQNNDFFERRCTRAWTFPFGAKIQRDQHCAWQYIDFSSFFSFFFLLFLLFIYFFFFLHFS